ncbi:type II toxin-antitoxin system death-on-curing family toxin [Rhodococcus qingshengii]|uniref:type II toxin-antitoxin system death-on-curing family toxin n=1 Tax=Rhodococcus qingshengii TaxID=334542 RepID=UPI0030176C54
MADFRYLPVAAIVAINADQAGGVGVADHDGIESAAARPASGAFGSDVFPTIWDKAAAYLHSFATTQYFTDGNKRTGWFAAVTFLRLNGHPLPSVPAIEAETFVNAVAQKVFDTEEDREATVRKAAEWFESKANHETAAAVASGGPIELTALKFDSLPGVTLRISRMFQPVDRYPEGWLQFTCVRDADQVIVSDAGFAGPRPDAASPTHTVRAADRGKFSFPSLPSVIFHAERLVDDLVVGDVFRGGIRQEAGWIYITATIGDQVQELGGFAGPHSA